MLSEQSKYTVSVALRSLIELVVFVARYWSVTTSAKYSARVVMRRVSVRMIANVCFME